MEEEVEGTVTKQKLKGLTSTEIKNLILCNGEGDPYNDELREVSRLLNSYAYNQSELDLFAERVWTALPTFRKNQIERDSE